MSRADVRLLDVQAPHRRLRDTDPLTQLHQLLEGLSTRTLLPFALRGPKVHRHKREKKTCFNSSIQRIALYTNHVLASASKSKS